MKKQFLYGRKKTGYCQLGEDYQAVDKQLLLQLTSMQNYIVAQGVDVQNLPEEYYAYSEQLEEGKVWIEGKTSFVPAGTSEESGSRDTSMIHKYIYSEDDFLSKLNQPVSASLLPFFTSVDDYMNGISAPVDAGEDYTWEQLYEKFNLDDDKLEDFIFCCLDAFTNYEKRVYCYLPTADRDGSLWAKRLMERLLECVPACVVANAGFTTYSHTFYNASVNPIPGNISVIFLPRNQENKMAEESENKNHYIFDFSNYRKQGNPPAGYVVSLIKCILKYFVHQDTKGAMNVIRNKLDAFVRMGNAADINFLGAFMLYCYKNKLLEAKDSKTYRTIASAIHDLLKKEEILTEKAKVEITNTVYELLADANYTEEDLEWIDHIYESGSLCKEIVIQTICNQCLKYAEECPKNDNESILFLVNYEYKDEETNDIILEQIYSQKQYYAVGKRLVNESVKPLRTGSQKTVQKKLDMLNSFMKSFCKNYIEFAISAEFREELAVIYELCIEESEDQWGTFDLISEQLSNISDTVYEAYCPLLQKIAFCMLKEFCESYAYREVDNKEFCRFLGLIDQWELLDFETKNSPDGVPLNVRKMKREEARREIEVLFKNEDREALLIALQNRNFHDAVALCKGNLVHVEALLEQLGMEKRDDTGYRQEFYKYFFATGNTGVIEKILGQIGRVSGINGIREFSLSIAVDLSDEEWRISKAVTADFLQNNPALWDSKKDLSYENVEFLRVHGIDAITATSGEKRKIFRGDKAREKDETDDLYSVIDHSEEDASKKKKLLGIFGGGRK